MRIKSRDLSLMAIFAALYAALVWVFAPISFYALQFRIAGLVRPAIAKKRILAVGYAIGVVVGNLFSPFTGIHELIFMPVMSLIAGVLGHELARLFRNSYLVSGMVIATVISISVSWMLNQIFKIPVIATLPSIFISEQIVCIIGSVIFKVIEARYEWWSQ